MPRASRSPSRSGRSTSAPRAPPSLTAPRRPLSHDPRVRTRVVALVVASLLVACGGGGGDDDDAAGTGEEFIPPTTEDAPVDEFLGDDTTTTVPAGLEPAATLEEWKARFEPVVRAIFEVVIDIPAAVEEQDLL